MILHNWLGIVFEFHIVEKLLEFLTEQKMLFKKLLILEIFLIQFQSLAALTKLILAFQRFRSESSLFVRYHEVQMLMVKDLMVIFICIK